ncbi:restriction endonuclease subunit S [Streptomyces sp. NBC_00984]|uniref:restriction endonuclease subunit S n=1 Tax=Streptomyces sp. NBC_00984 TaxID=2903700 RepID=UPI00386A6ECE|nr:restriction endonuclease subunit S [Streptomyces sp. NBC_00984]
MSAEPDEIRWVPVGEVGEVRMGKQLSPASKDAPGQMPYLRVANVFEGRIDYRDVNSMGFTDAEKVIYSLRPGDILLNEGQESLTNVGRSAVYDGMPDSICFQNTLIRFRASGSVVPEYAQAVFVNWRRMGIFARVAEKTSISHLGGSRFARMMFPLVPRRGQCRIVEILDAVTGSEQVALEEVAKLRTIRKVLVEQISRFEYVPMVNIIVDGPRNGIYKPEGHYGESGTPIVRINSFDGGPSNLTRGLLRVKVSDSEVRRYGIVVGDVLINRVNTPGLVGKSTVVSDLVEATLFESNIMRCRIDSSKIHPKIVEAWLSGSVVRAHFASRTKPAVSQASINRSDVFSCPIPKMDSGEQSEFLEKLEAIDLAIFESQARVVKLAQLRKGLTGDLLGVASSAVAQA